ncbi:MAG: 4Fe-4S dicluster domain-containing protein [Ignavibacteriales bacterium]
MNADTVKTLRGLAGEVLQSGKTSVVIGYREGWDGSRPVPCFIRRPEEAGVLIFDDRCTMSLAKYVIDFVGQKGRLGPDGRVAVLLKGCDSLGLRRLVMDRRIDRGSVYAVGVRCGIAGAGVPTKCAGCGNTEPVDCDVVIGETGGPPAGDRASPPTGAPAGDRAGVPAAGRASDCAGGPAGDGGSSRRDFSKIDELERLSAEERYRYWARRFERCIRCYACRNACPACHCRECSLDPGGLWLTAERTISEQAMYHFARAFHVAGRCTDCGECERVCPVGLPLTAINRKIMRDVKNLFGVEKPEMPEETEPFGRYSGDDPEEFM